MGFGFTSLFKTPIHFTKCVLPCALQVSNEWDFQPLHFSNAPNSAVSQTWSLQKEGLCLLLTFSAGTMVGSLLQAMTFGCHPPRWMGCLKMPFCVPIHGHSAELALKDGRMVMGNLELIFYEYKGQEKLSGGQNKINTHSKLLLCTT